MRPLIVLGMLFFVHFAYGQMYEVTYHRSTEYVSKNNSGLSLEMERKIKKMHETTQTVFVLKNFNGKSLYQYQHTLVSGEVAKDPRYKEGRSDFYKDFSKGYYVQVADFIGENTAVRERFAEVFDWQIDSSQDTVIAGLLCNRAVTIYNGHPVIAWFAPSIPIMDGPLRYAGLPGLILQVRDGLFVTEVTAIQIVNHQNEEIIVPEKENYISFKEMLASRTLTVRGKRIPKKKKE